MDRQALRRALAAQSLVRVKSRIRGARTVQGYPVACGRKWLLLHVLDENIVLDGYTALRLDDIRRVSSPHNSAFVRRALQIRRQWPPRRPVADLPLDRTADLIEAAASVYPLAGIHLDRTDPGIYFVGAATGVRHKHLRLVGITRKARWDSEASWWWIGLINRIDLGGGYQQALWEVARERTWPAVLNPPRAWPAG